MDENLTTLICGLSRVCIFEEDVVACRFISGDHTREETHVPIPNTTVKLTRPMIVQNSAKVGCCRVF